MVVLVAAVVVYVAVVPVKVVVFVIGLSPEAAV